MHVKVITERVPRTVEGVYDIPEIATRYHLLLSRSPDEKYYTLSVMNFRVSFEVSLDGGCGYKLREFGYSNTNSQAIEFLVKTKLIPLIEKY